MAKITLKGSLVHTNGTLPPIGSQAPDFLLINAELQERSLKHYVGKKILLSIVPSLNTGVCLMSAEKFNKALQRQQKPPVILVISADLPFAQEKVCHEKNLKEIETLSMMRDKQFAKDYGVLLIDGPLQGLSARAIVALNEKHVVIYNELVPEITQEPNYEKALTAFS